MFGFDQRTSSDLKWAFRHPLEFGWRMLHFGNMDLDKEIFLEREELMIDGALGVPSPDRNLFAKEIDWLKKNRWTAKSVRFPYNVVKTPLKHVVCAKDDATGLPYVLHDGRRLYFRKGTSLQTIEEDYRNFIDLEGIIGGGILEKLPHAYVDSGFFPETGDVILDVGCSEGLFALAYASMASKIYLFEAEKSWRLPIEKTFEDYRDKIQIMSRFVGSKTDGDQVKLSDVVNEGEDACYFLKMDIEGAEVDVIRSSLDFLSQHKVRISCCTYHRQSDAEIISALLRNIGYQITFSDGYMLTTMLGVRYPYFRRGVLRAKNF